MGCPSQCILGENLTFTIQAVNASGDVANATGSPAYSVYEDETAASILSGSMTQLSSQTGFYSEQIATTTANGFETYKSYTIRITATISGVSVGTAYTFLCLGTEDAPQSTTGALTTVANFKSYIGLTSTDDDALIGYLISRATDAIEKYCNRVLRSADYREFYDGNGERELLLRQYPITDVSALSIGRANALAITNSNADAWQARVTITATEMTLYVDGGANAGSDTLTLADYTVSTIIDAIIDLGKGWDASVVTSDYAVYDADELLPAFGLNCLETQVYAEAPMWTPHDFTVTPELAVVTLSCESFTRGVQNIVIRYTAGYVVTPADLEQICIDLTNIYYTGRKHDLSLKAERLADHRIEFSQDARDLPSHITIRLAPYKKNKII